MTNLKYCGCKDHPDRLDLSCAKIRRENGYPLSNAEIWQVISELTDENSRLKEILAMQHFDKNKRAAAMPNDQELSHAAGDFRQPETRSENGPA
jgi:hypothetical protein